jgi:hypothetical protein
MEARYFEFSTGGRDTKGRFPKKYTPCGRRLFQTQTQIKGFSHLALILKSSITTSWLENLEVSKFSFFKGELHDQNK